MKDDDPRHGTENGYNNLGCRCQRCKSAHARVIADRKQRRVSKGLAPDDPRHGKPTTYGNYGCRCDDCTEAWRVDCARRRARARARRATAA